MLTISTFSRRALLALAGVAVSLAAGAPPAAAAPAEPTMSIAQLRAALAASPTGTLSGSFKTVMKGYTVTDVPATIVAVVTDSPGTSLILFNASGDEVAGGIASGMSGSPLYVNDAGTDKLVGAVAYAGDFALDAAGLATPIEDMAAIESMGSVASAPLDRPVLTGRSLVDRVILTDEPSRYAGEAAAGALVAHPLSSTFIGGLKPTSAAYRLMSTALKARGIRPAAMSASGAAAEGPGPQALDAGASIAALVATGDAWVGGVGTETYRNGDDLLAFGHPMLGYGPTSMFLTDAWVDGAWKSSQSSFKFAAPTGDSRGVFTQDRTAGMLAKVGQALPVTTVTAHAERLSAAGASVSSADSRVDFSRPLFNSPLGFAFLAPGAAAVSSSRLYDSAYNPGSALTTTTIVVGDGVTTHTIALTNIVDDADDITLAATGDITFALSELLTVFDSGLYADRLSIRSVDLDATYSPTRRLAFVSGVEAPNGLTVGQNLVRVTLLRYGVEAPVVIEKTLTIPDAEALSGRLAVTCSNDLSQGSSSGSDLESVAGGDAETAPVTGAPDRRTIAGIVEDVNGSYAYNDLIIRVVPADATGIASLDASPAAEATAPTSYYLQGSASKAITSLTAALSKTTIPFGGTATVSGELAGPEAGATVQVYATPAGETERLVTSTKSGYGGESETPAFTAAVSGLQKNTKLRVVFRGDDDATFAEKTVTAKVAAKVTAGASKKSIKKNKTVKLTAKAYPAATAGGKVVFEYYSKRHHSWRPVATRTLARNGSRAEATYTWKIKSKGRWRVRARALAGATNAGGTSGSVTITVR